MLRAATIIGERIEFIAMNKQIVIIASVLTVVALLSLLGLSSYVKAREVETVRAQLDQAEADLKQARAAQTKSQAEADELRARVGASQTRIQELEREKKVAAQSNKSLEKELRTALESKDVTISQLQDKLTVSILDRVLFDSGEANLKSDGTAVLRKIAGVLAQHPNLKIHVIGHTDNVPIRAGARSRFPSNWELSTARATAAVRFLTERASVDPRRVGAIGYGEFRPVADNATPEGRAHNRRIAITILPDELAGADNVPTASTNAPAVLSPPVAPTEHPTGESAAPAGK